MSSALSPWNHGEECVPTYFVRHMTRLSSCRNSYSSGGGIASSSFVLCSDPLFIAFDIFFYFFEKRVFCFHIRREILFAIFTSFSASSPLFIILLPESSLLEVGMSCPLSEGPKEFLKCRFLGPTLKLLNLNLWSWDTAIPVLISVISASCSLTFSFLTGPVMWLPKKLVKSHISWFMTAL